MGKVTSTDGKILPCVFTAMVGARELFKMEYFGPDFPVRFSMGLKTISQHR